MAGPGIETQDPCNTSQMLYHWAIQADIHGPSSPDYHKFYMRPCNKPVVDIENQIEN